MNTPTFDAVYVRSDNNTQNLPAKRQPIVARVIEDDDPYGSVTVECGRLLCTSLRDALNAYRFKYGGIEFIESGGIFYKTFVIKGKKSVLLSLKKQME